MKIYQYKYKCIKDGYITDHSGRIKAQDEDIAFRESVGKVDWLATGFVPWSASIKLAKPVSSLPAYRDWRYWLFVFLGSIIGSILWRLFTYSVD